MTNVSVGSTSKTADRALRAVVYDAFMASEPHIRVKLSRCLNALVQFTPRGELELTYEEKKMLATRFV